MTWLFDAFDRLSVNSLVAMVEISIIFVFNYLVISSMKGTRGAGVARGALVFFIFLFVLLLFTVQLVQLENVRWIMENMVGVSLIGMIVVFQPEIRRGLIRIGEGAWRVYSGREASMEKEVADAAFQLARQNGAGALFVIERRTEIGGYIESGVPVDGTVTARLLTTIFTHNSPLHDGAVIIRKGRVAAASCLLPLSENVEVCRGMGTRHRAAIGLTEEADSLVVIVSEETSQVSLAVHGKIQRGLDYEGLRTLLREHSVEDTRLEGAGEVPGV